MSNINCVNVKVDASMLACLIANINDRNVEVWKAKQALVRDMEKYLHLEGTNFVELCGVEV